MATSLTSFAATSGSSNTSSYAFGLIGYIIVVAGMWKVFEKAKQPGWTAIIPIVSTFFALKVARRPLWWFILMLIPIVNIFVVLVINYDIAKAFGKGVGYMLLLTFIPILGWPMLGFGSSAYTAPTRG